jgi:hypothetical protein
MVNLRIVGYSSSTDFKKSGNQFKPVSIYNLKVKFKNGEPFTIEVPEDIYESVSNALKQEESMKNK